MKYLVSASEGPGSVFPEETLEALENRVLPAFDTLIRLEAEHKILAGGVPVGGRALVFIVEAASHDEVDRLVRCLPVWGALKWQVTPLQTFAGRAAQERECAQRLRQSRP
jgi:hypothetical protein